jgi:hypothetical protein
LRKKNTFMNCLRRFCLEASLGNSTKSIQN